MFRLCLCAGIFLIPLSVVADIGSLAAVNRDVSGTRPTESPRTLVLSDRLVQNERITTTELGGGQIMFLDQTTLTLTSNSDLILDRYVYNPDSDSGSLSVTLLQGTMRMVGGRITKKNAATIKTPSATIGIRGGAANITVFEDGSTEYLHIAGFSATIDGRNGEPPIVISREGGLVEISAPPGGPSRFSDLAIAAANASVTSDAGLSAQTELRTSRSQQGQSDAGQSVVGTNGSQTSGDGGGLAAASRADAPANVAEQGNQQVGSGQGGGAPTDPGQTDSARASATDGGATAGVGGDGRADRVNGAVQSPGQTNAAASDGGEQQTSSGTTSNDTPGGKPVYIGVASPERVASRLRITAGTGNGGSEVASRPGATQAGIAVISEQVSGQPGAPTEPPISTSGERETVVFNETPIEFADPPVDEFADDNQADAVAAEITQILDGITFESTWSPVAALADGTFAQGDNLPVELQYSLTAQEGFVTVGLPETGDLPGPNVTTMGGAAIIGDRFLVLGDDAVDIEADPTRFTLNRGDAAGTFLSVSPEDVLSGAIFLDYEDSDLANTSFVDGEVIPTVGMREVEVIVSEQIEAVRQQLDLR